jgi:DNA (cytosine-5)-methyltransferase 1
MKAIALEGRPVPIIVLENVCGTLSARGGADFAAIGSAIAGAGYKFGALVIDAVDFLPQSRSRLFVVAMRDRVVAPRALISPSPIERWHPRALISAWRKMSPPVAGKCMWFKLPEPSPRRVVFSDLVEDEPKGVKWHEREETEKILAMMSASNLAKVRSAQKLGRRTVGSVYKRTRLDLSGRKIQRAEVRFDEVAGCLRTPAGGSSRQVIIVVEGESVRTPLLSPREAARLMGLPENYLLPPKYNEAYHLAGDGVVIPVVRYIAEYIIEPILERNFAEQATVAHAFA